ncbi:MAG: hypothetical protein KDC12_11705, partial [Flavobacteriales bacterium]|nr:hypothetical protein [Flavobacteriales bacterium]
MGNTRTSNIFFGVVLVLAFSFAAMKFALPILVALLVLVGVARLSWRRPPFALVMLGVLYLMYVIGLLGSEDVQASAKFLEYKASLLVFPLLFALAPRHSANGELRVMMSFTLGCLVFDLFALGNGLADAIETGNWGELGYKKLAIIFHPTYLSIYNAFAWSW